jgi:hypothetical protein
MASSANEASASAVSDSAVKTESGKALVLAPWWGAFDVPLGEQRHFRIGPCALWVERLARELRVSRIQHEDPLDRALVVGEASTPVPPGCKVDAQRFAVSGQTTRIELEPALADRPVVVRTHEPFHVLAGDEATLYVTTPLWIRMFAGAERKRMFELPVARPSDTWFGENTRSGELCYAGTTAARLALAELPLRPGRAVTQVRIVNRSRTPLALDRINLPAPALSLFAASDHRLWTESIEIVRDEGTALRGGISIRRGGAPDAASGAKLCCPREAGDSNLLLRAFKALLS